MTGVAGETEEYKKAEAWSLVLLAANIPHLIVQHDYLWRIMVDVAYEEKSRRELMVSEEENRNWPPPDSTVDTVILHSAHNPPTILVMGMLMVFYGVTGPAAHESIWFAKGSVNSLRILTDGEWWRLITGLTLHADPVHLLGNLIIGGILVHYLCRQLGVGLGWLLIMLCGALGNVLNVVFRGPGHISVGFSTAVFAAVGMLSGLQIGFGKGLKGFLLPLGAGIGLLAFLGSSGERVDLGAHLWGAVVGLTMGLLIGKWQSLTKIVRSGPLQFVMFTFCLLVVYGAWHLAIGN